MKRPLQQLKTGIQRLAFGVTAFAMLAFATPTPYAFADGAADPATQSADTCTPVEAAPTGVTAPTGAESVMFKYNKCTGLWESQYYTWSPATHEKTPITPLVYSCNESDWQWQTVQWVFVAAKVAYEQRTVTVDQLPTGAVVAATSANPCAPPPPVVTAPTAGAATAVSTPTGTAGGTTTVSAGTNNSATLNNTTGVSLINQIGSVALSGSVSVVHNTTAGNATSGDATAIANVLNMLQSSSALGSDAATFVATIDGDVQGDLLIDPSLLQPASGTASLNSTNNLTVNTATNNTIANDINLDARSGNAVVSGNTTAGSATSGNATAVANVVNMINAMIGANQSFVGVININGNLEGNILVPQNFLDSLIASNAPHTTVTINTNTVTNANISTTNNQAITNNVSTTATSGNAAVTGNTTAGSATSGQSGTHVTIFNLTGNQVIGTNSLLVFVNVLGQWVGVIMNAPTGSTAAALGSNISENAVTNVNMDTTTNNSITNTITAAATSGDASVTHNTTAGNATSGDAHAAVNLLNIDNAQFNLSNWFGVLFINVFGSWFGNFGVAPPPTAPTAPTASTGQQKSSRAKASAPPVFRFVPTGAVTPTTTAPTGSQADGTTVNAELTSKVQKVLASSTASPNKDIPGKISAGDNHQAQIIGGTLAVFGLVVLAGERLVNARRNARA